MSLQSTPRADRVHIGIFGLRNSGKSSLINALTGQNIAIVSDVAGTTTDPVYKAMEVHGIGPCVFIDTAGFDDVGSVGELRNKKTQSVIDKTDIAIVVIDPSISLSVAALMNLTDTTTDTLTDTLTSKSPASILSEDEIRWLDALKAKNTPIIAALNKVDLYHGDSSVLNRNDDHEITVDKATDRITNKTTEKTTEIYKE
ncbi:MAG: GTP-binding protein, partial [Clostridiales bacterium]|nr:GTP-binding protein [Clostridiales bacterium]